ncbi:MAG: TIGR01620 family protein [Paracoccaceae bacterium]
MTDPAPLKRPSLIELDDAPAANPAQAEAIPDLDTGPIPPGPIPPGRAMQTLARASTGRTSPLSRAALWVFSTLFAFILSVAAWDFVTSLLNRNSLLGSLALLLVGAALAVLLLLALREAAAFARMARIDRLRGQATAARATADLAAARRVTTALASLYHARPETAWGLARLKDHQAQVLDADALLNLAETELMAPLDTAALAEIEAAARQVATVTALVPMALADVATALFVNLRMIRRLAQIYGGRSSTIGNLALLRRVFTALLGAGALALADDLIGSVTSGGILGKLSRRFGEGVVNGALTARVGLAAMEACRPLPFVARDKPGTTATISRALAGFLSRAKDQG